MLRGPSASLYGQTDPGGLINMVSKRPTATPQHEIIGTFGSFNRFQGAFDSSGPIDKNGEFLYRIVGLGYSTDGQQDFVHQNKVFIAPSLTWRPTTDTSFTILSQYQNIDNKGWQQYVPGDAAGLRPNPFGRIPYSRYIGEPSADGYKLEQFSVGYALEHRFDNNLQFRSNFRYFDVKNNVAGVRSEGLLPDFRTALRSFNYVNSARAERRARQSAPGRFRDRSADSQGSRRLRLSAPGLDLELQVRRLSPRSTCLHRSTAPSCRRPVRLPPSSIRRPRRSRPASTSRIRSSSIAGR